MNVRNFLKALKQDTQHLNYGRGTIAAMVTEHLSDLLSKETLRVLDVGFGSGKDLLNIKDALGGHEMALYGIDSYDAYIEKATEKSILPSKLNIEHERFPFEDGFFHIVIANQVIEHTKQIFWIFSEISRVLQKSGMLIIGVPNLAALHNRVLLLLGSQPACIEVLGPHVRGFTRPSLTHFINSEGYFRVLEVRGANFYPFPAPLARILARWLPSLAVGLIFFCVRTDKDGTFIEVLKKRRYQTDYFSGE